MDPAADEMNNSSSQDDVAVMGTSAGKGPSRCDVCQKRVGLTGFNCRCGGLFCALHRYSDKHDCHFDYKGHERAVLMKNNPIVQAPKIDKI